MQIWGRRLVWGLAAPFAILSLWFAAGLIGALWPAESARFDGPAGIEIGLVGTPIHYDLLLPLTPDLRRRFTFAADANVAVLAENAEWLLVGWGARDFYMSAGSYSDVPMAAVAKAILGDSAVMRLEAWGAVALEDMPGARKIRLSAEGYRALLSRLDQDLGLRRLVKAPGLTAQDAFFASRGDFSGLRTCNVWVGEVLRAAGVRLGAWTPTPQSLRLSLWWNAVRTP